jgi:histidine triad (HIT) family protein
MASTPVGASASCPFCALVAHRAPAHWVLEEPNAVAFLDSRPVFLGHVLLVPRAHVETLIDLPAGDVGPLFQCAQRIARAVEEGLAADGTFVAMNNRVSQSVPHFHVHVIPRRKKDGLRGFFWPRQSYGTDGAAAEVAAKIRASLERTSWGSFFGYLKFMGYDASFFKNVTAWVERCLGRPAAIKTNSPG